MNKVNLFQFVLVLLNNVLNIYRQTLAAVLDEKVDLNQTTIDELVILSFVFLFIVHHFLFFIA